jgi:superfamily II DNA or RNA helicase
MSFPTFSELADHQGLVPWLAGAKWKQHFKPAPPDDVKLPEVLAIRLKDTFDDGDDDACDLLVSSTVRDSMIYQVKLFLMSRYDPKTRSMDLRMTTWCSCPENYAGKHAAAVLEKLKRIADHPPKPGEAETRTPAASTTPGRVLTGLTPTPVLHITNVYVGIYQKRHIGGLVKFEYPGSPRFLPLAVDADPKAEWFEGATRVVLERDRSAEMALAAGLKHRGFTPLHEILPAHELNDKNRHSVVLQHPTTRASDWLEFLDSPDCTALRADGWIVESDPNLGITIHDIRDFFPSIVSGKGKDIDWFRFDVTGEFEGKTISLIPQIARAIREDWHLRYPDPDLIPESLLLPCDKPADGHIRFPARRFLEMLEKVRHLFHGDSAKDGNVRLDRISAATVADALAIDSSETTRSLAALGRNLRNIQGLPASDPPASIRAELRHYQLDGFRWLQFLADHGLHGILADDMGLGKTLQTLAHLAAQAAKTAGRPSLVIAPTSVVPNWAAEAEKFVPDLKVLVLHGGDRADRFDRIPAADLVLTSYPLLVRDLDQLHRHHWHTLVLDEAQAIKNPRAQTAISACGLKASHRVCLSGTPMENHLGELWSLMRFLMPGFLSDEKTFNTRIRKPIERDRSKSAQLALNRRVSPLILRRTKDQVATELPAKTTLIHNIDLPEKQADLYESVRAAMDERVRNAIADKGLAKSHIIVLDALLKLRQICCHPGLLKSEAAQNVSESAKLDYLTGELLPTLLEEGRRILLFSQFTSVLELISGHLDRAKTRYLKLTGQTKERAGMVGQFQTGGIPVFLISLKAGGTGLNLTAADTIIHYDPWWNPAAENQATDRAHRIGQTRPVFVHKLICRGTIEDRILALQKHKAALVEALLSEETTKLRIDEETLSQLLAPLT